ncbi:hypothetical protein LTR84_012626 [Exophiala bonariae]|uniref:Mitochondrial genome maintenance protein MGM101 n=1 Tax=Exophiala bonariae TaxID=1690606 RepID=A0AAV9NFK3_9EURO|nr:hypothetical protein LTR84_012626 [Exophiala bonariae]
MSLMSRLSRPARIFSLTASLSPSSTQSSTALYNGSVLRPSIPIATAVSRAYSTSLSPKSTASAAPKESSKPSSPLPSRSNGNTSSSSAASQPGIEQEQQVQEENTSHVDWTKSFHGLSVEPFSKDAADILLAPLETDDVEIKPDGIIYLPEIKYRRILNKAFGPGGWGLAPRGETIVTEKAVTREYALLAHGRLVSIARGEQDYFNKDGVPTASEGCKSNAMMRCCKDLGVASELWDPRFIRKWKAANAREVFVEHQGTKRKTKIWLRKGDPVSYPYAELKK